MSMYPDFAYYIKAWATYLNQGYDTDIHHWGDRWIETKLGNAIANQLSHAVIRGKMIASTQVLKYYKEPWTNGWILAEEGLDNYRGMITDNNIDKIVAEVGKEKHTYESCAIPEELFDAIKQDGALPRKTFSMGHAADKRFYIEARKL